MKITRKKIKWAIMGRRRLAGPSLLTHIRKIHGRKVLVLVNGVIQEKRRKKLKCRASWNS